MKNIIAVGLLRLQNFVNVYTNFRNQNDSVYMQYTIMNFFHYRRLVKLPYFS